MKFSLKTLLIALIAVGVTAGVLGRLCFSHPEVFLMLVGMLSSFGPFLLAIGTIIWLGFRRRSAWSAPRCGNCKRDLRRVTPDRAIECPDCGADLTEPQSVQFERNQGRRWGLVVWGVVLLVAPMVGFGLVFLVGPYVGTSPGDLRVQSTQQLVQQQLPKRVDEPWVWNELDSRLDVGSLSQQEVDDAIKQLIVHMKATNPDGYGRSLSWQDDFVESAVQAGLISEPVFIDMCDAFYGPKPIVQPLPRIRENDRSLEIRIEYGNTWGNHSGLGTELLWDVNRVLLDGEPVEVRQNHKHGESWSGSYEGSLTAGDHELSVEVECAYVDQDKLIGLNTNDLPGSRWPKARKRWKQTVSAPLKVYSQEDRIVPLTSDPNRDPGTTGGIEIERCVVQADRNNTKKIILQVQYTDGLSIPISCDVAVKVDGQTVKIGRLWAVRNQNSQTHSSTQLEGHIDAIMPDTQYLDVILTPNPSHIEQRPEVSEIWGEKIVLPGIKIERLDLEAGDP